MSRSLLSLAVLLTTLAGPLLFPPRVRGDEPALTCPAEAYGVRSVCTPPGLAVHPADGYAPYACFFNEHAASVFNEEAAADESVASTEAVETMNENVEDWQDFVVDPRLSEPLSDVYDDLFQSLNEVAPPERSTVVEADPEAYQSQGSAAETEYDPSAANSIEAYESEFSGYGTTDYVRNNFDYAPLTVSGPSIVRKLGNRLTENLLSSTFIADLVTHANDGLLAVRCWSAELSVEQMLDDSELAWERIEEARRASLSAIRMQEAEFRLADDDCGWDCWRDLNTPIAAEVAPAKTDDADADADRLDLNRESLRSLALTLRSLAEQLESASNWVAGMGGINVAELDQDAPR